MGYMYVWDIKHTHFEMLRAINLTTRPNSISIAEHLHYPRVDMLSFPSEPPTILSYVYNTTARPLIDSFSFGSVRTGVIKRHVLHIGRGLTSGFQAH